MERCPACRARLADEVAVCPRCACDLSLPLRAQRSARHYAAAAARAVAEGQPAVAIRHARRALSLHDSPLARAIFALAYGAIADKAAG